MGVLSAFLLVPRVSARFVVRTVSFYFEGAFLLFSCFYVVEDGRQLTDSLLVLAFDDEHERLDCSLPPLQLDPAYLAQFHDVQCFVELVVFEIELYELLKCLSRYLLISHHSQTVLQVQQPLLALSQFDAGLPEIVEQF